MERFLKLFTDLPLEDIAELLGGDINEAKKVLATEATAMAHDRAAAEQAAETARQAFELGSSDADLPSVEIDAGVLEAGVPAYEALRLAGLVKSNGEGRRLIKGGGARVNDVAIKAEDQAITMADAAGGAVKLSAGKKRHVLLKAS